MNFELLNKLKDWRDSQARKEGVDLFRVLTNKTIEDIVLFLPKTKDDLLNIKGIKEKKFDKYGLEILAILNGGGFNQSINQGTMDFGGLSDAILDAQINTSVISTRHSEERSLNEQFITKISPGHLVSRDDKGEQAPEKFYTVGDYLNNLNNQLRNQEARIKGEISSFSIKGGCVYFALKDKKDGSLLNCFMWKRNYDLCGISLEEGMEIIAGGFPEIYKPAGKLTLQVSVIELVGEGVLKKAYLELRKKLEGEGLFDESRKKLIPEFPQKIGLITSETGAVINDFLNNLGKYGYQIKFYDSRVEGQVAVRDLVRAINYFENKDIDVLVMIRGGGSLESLQAFNNESLVRKISNLKFPVLVGIGHDKDVPLISLVADRAVSTPTAVTVLLNKSWDSASKDLSIFERDLIYKYQKLLSELKYEIENLSNQLKKCSTVIFRLFEELKYSLKKALLNINHAIKDSRNKLDLFENSISQGFKNSFNKVNLNLDNLEKRLIVFDPMRQLKLGYSIVSVSGKIIRSINQIEVGNDLDIQVVDGKIKSVVKEISN